MEILTQMISRDFSQCSEINTCLVRTYKRMEISNGWFKWCVEPPCHLKRGCLLPHLYMSGIYLIFCGVKGHHKINNSAPRTHLGSESCRDPRVLFNPFLLAGAVVFSQLQQLLFSFTRQLTLAVLTQLCYHLHTFSSFSLLNPAAEISRPCWNISVVELIASE